VPCGTEGHDSLMSTILAELPEEHHAARSARIRRDNADRARRWRDQQRETAETDAVLVRALLKIADAYITPEGRVMARESHVDIADVFGRAAYDLGGRPRFKEAKARVFNRLMELAPAHEGNA